MTDWQKFFLVRLPLAALALGLATELTGYLLSGVALHRHNVDDLAAAVTHDTHPYGVVLLGDSVTHNVAHKFRIGKPEEVADLTTHALAGLPSSLFLLRRYLETGHQPKLVILAVSRNVFVLPVPRDTFQLYIQSVFTRPFERQFLQKYYGNDVDYRWRPAALAVESKVIEPLFSLLRNPKSEIWVAPDVPSRKPELDRFPDDSDDPTVLAQWVATPFELRPEARAVLIEICRLAREYHFELHLIWAPLEPGLRRALESKDSLQHLNSQLTQVFAENDTPVRIDDSSTRRTYPYFDDGLIHIKGAGWEQAYADDLGDYIHEFEANDGMARPALSSGQTASSK